MPMPPAPITATRRPGTTRPLSASAYDATDGWSIPCSLGALVDTSTTVELRATHTYLRPGTYFATVRVTSQRDGDPDAPYTRIQNLARVRVEVR